MDGEWLSESLPHVEAWRARAKPRSSDGALVDANELGSALRSTMRNIKVDIPGTYDPSAAAPTSVAAPEDPGMLERVLSGGEWTAHEKALMRDMLKATVQ